MSICSEFAATGNSSAWTNTSERPCCSMKASTTTFANEYKCSSIHSASLSDSAGHFNNTRHISGVTRRASESGRADPTANFWAVPLRPCRRRTDCIWPHQQAVCILCINPIVVWRLCHINRESSSNLRNVRGSAFVGSSTVRGGLETRARFSRRISAGFPSVCAGFLASFKGQAMSGALKSQCSSHVRFWCDLAFRIPETSTARRDARYVASTACPITYLCYNTHSRHKAALRRTGNAPRAVRPSDSSASHRSYLVSPTATAT